MALERDPWLGATYNGFARNAREARAAPRPPASSGSRRGARMGFAIAGIGALALGAAAAVVALPIASRLWSQAAPTVAALGLERGSPVRVASVTAVAAPAPAPAVAIRPAVASTIEQSAPYLDLQPHPVAASAPPKRVKARPRPERARSEAIAAIRVRESAATAAANLEATYAPESTLADQAAALSLNRY